MGKREYLNFLIPLLKQIDPKEILKEDISQEEIREFGERLRCKKTDKYVETVRIYRKQLLNVEDIPKPLRKIFLALIIGAGYQIVDFFGEEEAVKFSSNINS